MRKNIFRSVIYILIFTFIVIGFSSCVPSKPVDEERILPADRLIKKLEANRRKIKTFLGSGRINLDSPQLTAKATFQVALQKPDSIRISFYGPFGIDLAQAVATKRDFVFYDVINNKVYRGVTKDLSLKNIFKVDLTFNELMDAFAGAVDLTDKLRREPDDLFVNDNSYFLTYSNELTGRKNQYEILIDDLAITKYKIIEEPSNIILEGSYKDFDMFEDVPLPYKIDIDYKLMNQKISIEYRNIKVNQSLPNLTINIPEDADIVEW
ncbi:MAG: DUF4292 domain-containing protein [Melioribacteraceae bacterium]|nr:DUF4292 domain-containing protein [Melioribacteraceae bacterium]